MASTRFSNYLNGFTRLSPNVYHLPASSTPKTGPNLIILSAWMGAQPRHISKYVAVYATVYPGVETIVIFNDENDFLFRSLQTQLRRLEPVLALIAKAEQERGDKAKILLESWSNGGTIQATHLAREYRRRYSKPLPISYMIIDSAPGTSGYWGAYKAFTAGAPKFFLLRWLVLGATHVFVTVFLIMYFLFPKLNALENVRRELNDAALFPLKAPKTYIYTREDELVAWDQVEAHAGAAKKSGYMVDLQEFKGSRHVGHLMTDPARYEAIIKGMSA